MNTDYNTLGCIRIVDSFQHDIMTCKNIEYIYMAFDYILTAKYILVLCINNAQIKNNFKIEITEQELRYANELFKSYILYDITKNTIFETDELITSYSDVYHAIDSILNSFDFDNNTLYITLTREIWRA